MSVRVISTKIAIEGEAAYRQSITNINSELRNLQSSLKLTESNFDGNANSMEALKAKGDALRDLYKDYPSIMREWGLNHIPQPEPEARIPVVGDTVTVRLNAPVNYLYESPVTIKEIKGNNALLSVGEQLVAVAAIEDLQFAD